ncbi:Putative HTH-type transcriptional regulator [Burkholderiales bacterium]|nr:Putative HTH-type transcriptional regulator [Burkholderiales bacterium]
MPVRLHLFGSPAIDSGGESLALPFERRNQVVVFLALKRSWVGRAELATLIWPDQAGKLAYANLRKTLFRLQALPWGRRIEVEGRAVRLEAGTDVFDFETALREQRVADALPFRRGELLAGFEDDRNEAWSSWLGYERERLRAAWRGAAIERLASDIDPGEGIELSARLLDADPLDEAALRAHMVWLAHGGQGARARRAYREFVGRLREDLGLAPGAELKALHDSLGTSAGPPVPAASAARSAPDDRFVGRSVELGRIAELLARDECRLLSLIGPGGVGKTRLAQRAVRDLAPGYADGATFVPLEDVASSGEFGGRLAREIGVDLVGSAEPLDQVVRFLRERHMLLVLDNFEQLAAHASLVERLLQACPRLKIIVTSRVRLAAAMEWSLPLEGLPCPEVEDQDRIDAFDAVRLFVDAARRVEPALIPSVEAAAIVDICRQVEGLPLMLELAASWTRVLSCDAIAAELRQGTELLRAVDPARPARHASIEVVFDQSWKLLSAVERDALSRLSVFRGGFSAEAARAVAAASLPVLGALADKSLLRKDGARAFLHPMVHQLAAARLGDGDNRASTESAHARYFLDLLAQLRRAVDNGDRDTLRRLDAEFENCRAAWRWSAVHGKADALARGTPTLVHFCDHRGRFEEGLSLLREAVECRPAHADPRFEPLLSSAVAHFQFRLDRYADAEATASRALAATRATRDHDTRVQCLRVLGGCCLRLGRLGDARRHFRQALQQSPANVDPHSAAGFLDNLALVEKRMGRYAEALRMSMESLVQHRRLADVAGEALCLNNLGALQLDQGEHESAAVHFKAGLALSERHGLVNPRGFILANLTELALKTGDPDAAQDYARRALEVAEQTRNRATESWLKLQFVRIALGRGDLDAARADLRASLEAAIAIGRPSLQLAGVSSFAEVLAAQGALDCARRVRDFAVDHPSTTVQERDDMLARLGHWGPAVDAEPAWRRPELGELVHRIVVETDVAHSPLIASIRGAG